MPNFNLTSYASQAPILSIHQNLYRALVAKVHHDMSPQISSATPRIAASVWRNPDIKSYGTLPVGIPFHFPHSAPRAGAVHSTPNLYLSTLYLTEIDVDGMLSCDGTGPSTSNLLVEYMRDQFVYPHKSVAKRLSLPYLDGTFAQ